MDDSVSSWLDGIHLGEYVSTLSAHGYDTLDKCATIPDKGTLRDMGVTKVGHLNRLYRAVEKLRGEDSSATLPPNATLGDWSPGDRKSKSMTLLTAKPPPVPTRRSVRRSPTSPVDSRSPTPPDMDIRPHPLDTKPRPPPAPQRSKSLRKVPSDVLTESGKDSATPLSPILQSPTVLDKDKAPPKPRPRKTTPSSQQPPQPKPRTPKPYRKTTEPKTIEEQLVEPTPVNNGQTEPVTSPTELPPLPPKKTAPQIVAPLEGVVFELEDIPMPSPTTTGFIPPAIPPKHGGPPSFSPPLPPESDPLAGGDSVPLFEEPLLLAPGTDLETAETVHQTLNSDIDSEPVTLPNESEPITPPRDVTSPPRVPSSVPVRRSLLSPPPPPAERVYTKTMSVDQLGLIEPSSLPDVPANSDPLTVPPRESQPAAIPPLPPKDKNGPPNFKPPPPSEILPPPPPERKYFKTIDAPLLPDFAPPPLPLKDTPTVEATNEIPPLPPKETRDIPPPLPVTADDYPQEDSCSESEDERTFMSIRSTNVASPEPLGLTSLSQPVTRTSTSDSSSEEGSPVHRVISQRVTELIGDRSSDRMILTPPPTLERDDYANQEVIDKMLEEDEDCDEISTGGPLLVKGTPGVLNNDLELMVSNGHVFDDEQELLPRQRMTIKSMSAVKSEQPDYVNQDVLDENIIPLTIGPEQPHSILRNNTNKTKPAEDQNTCSRLSTYSAGATYPRTKSDASFLPRGDSVSSARTPDTEINFPGSNVNEQGSMHVNLEFPDGGHLIRTAGTFAGGDIQYRRPDYGRSRSDAPSTILEAQAAFTESIYAKSTRHGSETFHDVPKTKDGYLYKKGGRRSERPWQKRWMTFNGSELKYFKNQSDKDRSYKNIVPLQEMIDIKKVQDDEKSNRFDLVVINRVFQFYALSTEDAQAWVDVLHAAISKFKPQEHQFKEGGNMHDPDKQGLLLKQGHGALNKGFRERYVALKGSKFAYYESKEDFLNGRPIHVLEMSLSSVRPDISSKLPRFIITMNNMKQYVFQAGSDLERKEWLDTMTTAILTGLDTRPQTISRGGSNTSSQDILAQVQENPSNRSCADCSASDPSWGVINKGIMVCINCSGVHRSLGVHIAKVRSIELDRQIWKTSLIKLMVGIGNDNSNRFWERHYTGERLPADVERDIREGFIRAKYEMMSWIPRPTGESREALNKLLCVAVSTDNLIRTIELLSHGAKACGTGDGQDSPLTVARDHGQDAQVELLEQNGGLICRSESSQSESSMNASKRGHLHKTGSDRSGWKKRFCTLDKFRGFEYFKAEGDTESLGYIHFDEMLSVSRCDDESSRDPRYRHCFEVNTQGRGYLLCADTEEDMTEWIAIFEQIIPQDAADNLGYDKVGYLKKKDHMGGFKRRWFTLKGKSLSSYKREREEIDEIDLRKVTELKSPDPGGNYEQMCTFNIYLGDKNYQLRADTPGDAEAWISALKHTQVSGIPLAEQQLTGTGIPILVHKCLQFVESYGMETEGLYRLSGGKANSRKLVLAFNQDARGVVIDPEVFTVHDVTGTLKQFFRSLPDPLLTHRLYGSFITTMQSDHESQMYQLQSLIEQLPPVNRETLRRMAGHLKRVAQYELKNKMGLSNLVRLFAPTLMTVDGDPVTFENTQLEYACVHTMVKHYKWIFQVDEQEAKKEEAIEAAMRKIKEADQMQTKTSVISSSMDFLTRVYIGSKEGDSYGINITGTSLVSDVVEKVVTDKALPPNHYALYLVLGDSESHRVLSFTERLLAVLCSTGSDCFLCLKPNAFGETLKQYINYVKEVEPVLLQVREKKKWKKYPCVVRNDCFIQFKDPKCHNEQFRLAVQDFDVFAGIEGSKIDVKNPLPTRYCFWLKAMRGDKCRYLCADSEEDMLKIIAWIVKAKYPDQLQTPLLPTRPPPASQPPMLDMSAQQPSPVIHRSEELRDYANVKVSGNRR